MPAGQSSFPQFILICLNNLYQVPEKIAEAKLSGYPFSLVLIEVGYWQWGVVQNVVEQIWTNDPILRCVLFLPPGHELSPENLFFSRPEQWSICRFPVLKQDLYQLARCLSVEKAFLLVLRTTNPWILLQNRIGPKTTGIASKGIVK